MISRGFKALRARWLDHLASCSRRSVILIDEAQEMSPVVLNELRLRAMLAEHAATGMPPAYLPIPDKDPT